MITCIFDHFTLHLRFTTVMRNTLRRRREILNPRLTLIKLSYRQVFLLNILKNNKTQEEYTFRMIFNIVLFA